MLVDPDGRRLPAGIDACLSNPLALGGDRSLPNLITAMMAQKKYSEVIEPLTQELVEKPGDSSVLANRALAYMNSGRSREGIVDWEAAAADGSADAQNNMGRLYMMGVPGVLNPDPAKGIDLFHQSANQGNAAGQQNYQRALKLFPSSTASH